MIDNLCTLLIVIVRNHQLFVETVTCDLLEILSLLISISLKNLHLPCSLPVQVKSNFILFQEEEHYGYTDGTFHGRRYFQCAPRKAMFVPLNTCKKDSRFQDIHPVLSDTKIKSKQNI